jgi:hypothetical protein
MSAFPSPSLSASRLDPRSGLEDALRRADPALLAAGLLLLALLPAFLLPGQTDARTVGGVGTWVKPAKFAASVGVHLVTLALLWGWTGGFGQRRAGRILARVIVFAGLFEVVYIAFRAANGEPSHYNLASPLAILMFQLMGVGATILVLGPAAAGIAAWRSGATASMGGHASVVAMVASGILAFVTGAALSANGGHFVGTHLAGSPTWPLVGWSTTAGDLRAAHFVALHILQAVPLAALAAAAAAPGRVRAMVLATALVLSALSLAAMGWALSGRALAF